MDGSDKERDSLSRGAGARSTWLAVLRSMLVCDERRLVGWCAGRAAPLARRLLELTLRSLFLFFLPRPRTLARFLLPSHACSAMSSSPKPYPPCTSAASSTLRSRAAHGPRTLVGALCQRRLCGPLSISPRSAALPVLLCCRRGRPVRRARLLASLLVRSSPLAFRLFAASSPPTMDADSQLGYHPYETAINAIDAASHAWVS